ncbi:putative DNA-binding protein (MmcQ/YjbR family) [Murinocardiopsis flavida]|uniref:Putative DNA-binding protein (MmcQ/YjbR family) n=1 Tax=Murinocardiopsis flavida TaxID=645275 RepID=A0A2P8DGF7_9ACTN|nr:MmcQ/YjbR family DNA-binding protein [Murinocardiopsis flavida]PSK96300.1 putative DNA-binding protein (MmcQ/YjbR family) [Murinocardiopsis flavida]
MVPEQIMDAALWFPESAEDEPFGPNLLVYRVADRIFALMQPEDGRAMPAHLTLKCEPALALELRGQFGAVIPGYHVNKKHWNSVLLDGTVPDDEIVEMLRHSYERVVSGLRKADRERLLAVLGTDLPPVPDPP